MPVGTDAEEEEIELCVAELGFVVLCGALLAELALDPVHRIRPAFERVEKRLLRHPVVRVLVVRRDAALVAPPERNPAPVGFLLRCLFVRELGRLPSGQHDVSTFVRRAHESLGDDFCRLLLVLDDDELDLAAVHGSPAASSFDRSMAA